jgi:hypothetical protein
MSRTIRDATTKRKRPDTGRARGISKLKAMFARMNRRRQDRAQKSSDNPVIEQPKRLRNFWWEWW